MDTQTATINSISRKEKAGVVLLVMTLAFVWNWQFIHNSQSAAVLAMNDVNAILKGFYKTPHLLIDGISWWHGPWIEDEIRVFRPISSYFLLIESLIGLNWGFLWVSWIGYSLFVLDCLIAVMLAWRFTQSKFCTLLTAVLAPALPFYNWMGTQPRHWLAWYPVHHDLLMICFLLSALLFFKLWLETNQRKHLGLTWLFFILGALSKEFVYIFPLMAAMLLLGQRDVSAVAPRRGLIQVGFMLVLVLCLFLYRAHVLIDPYNPPPLKWTHFKKKPLLYWFGPYFIYLRADPWFAGLAVLLFLSGALFTKLRRTYWRNRPSTLLAWSPLSVFFGFALYAYCTLANSSVADTFWFIFDPGVGSYRLRDLIIMVFILYSFHLLWKYRTQEPTLAIWLLMILSYIPVFTYLGWHYTLTGWFIRSAILCPVIVKLAWHDMEHLAWIVAARKRVPYLQPAQPT